MTMPERHGNGGTYPLCKAQKEAWKLGAILRIHGEEELSLTTRR